MKQSSLSWSCLISRLSNRPLRASESFQRPCLHSPSISENGDIRNLKAFHNIQKHQNFLLQRKKLDDNRYAVWRTLSYTGITPQADVTSLNAVSNRKRIREFLTVHPSAYVLKDVDWDIIALKGNGCFEEICRLHLQGRRISQTIRAK